MRYFEFFLGINSEEEFGGLLGLLTVATKKGQEPVFFEYLLCAGTFTSVFSPQQSWGESLTVFILQIRTLRLQEAVLLRVPART